jgi:hypothetical protein
MEIVSHWGSDGNLVISGWIAALAKGCDIVNQPYNIKNNLCSGNSI